MCSAAETTVDSGALATTIPRLVAASTSTLSTPTPARPMTFSRSRALEQRRRELGGAADDDAVVAADDLLELGVAVLVDVEALAQELDAGGGDRLADQDARPVGQVTRAGSANASSARLTAAPRSIVGAEAREHVLDRRRAPS